MVVDTSKSLFEIVLTPKILPNNTMLFDDNVTIEKGQLYEYAKSD